MGVATEFVYVERVEHGDFMHIPKQVQEKYPKIYKLAVEDVPVIPVVEAPVVAKEEAVVVEAPKKTTPKKGK